MLGPPGRGGGVPAACPCFTEAPGNPSNRSLRELLVSPIYKGRICSLTRESDCPELPREEGAELGFEPGTVRRQVLPLPYVYGVPLGRTQHDGEQSCDPKDMALVLLSPRICVIIRDGGLSPPSLALSTTGTGGLCHAYL